MLREPPKRTPAPQAAYSANSLKSTGHRTGQLISLGNAFKHWAARRPEAAGLMFQSTWEHCVMVGTWAGWKFRATALTARCLPRRLSERRVSRHLNDTNTQPARKTQNSKSYERTRQLIENKGQQISNTVNSLKLSSLTSLPRQDIENMTVMF